MSEIKICQKCGHRDGVYQEDNGTWSVHYHNTHGNYWTLNELTFDKAQSIWLKQEHTMTNQEYVDLTNRLDLILNMLGEKK